MTAEEQSKATTTTITPGLHPKQAARRYRDGLKRDLEKLDQAAALVVEELCIQNLMLPEAVYKSAPGTYARHVYNTLSDIVGVGR